MKKFISVFIIGLLSEAFATALEIQECKFTSHELFAHPTKNGDPASCKVVFTDFDFSAWKRLFTGLGSHETDARKKEDKKKLEAVFEHVMASHIRKKSLDDMVSVKRVKIPARNGELAVNIDEGLAKFNVFLTPKRPDKDLKILEKSDWEEMFEVGDVSKTAMVFKEPFTQKEAERVKKGERAAVLAEEKAFFSNFLKSVVHGDIETVDVINPNLDDSFIVYFTFQAEDAELVMKHLRERTAYLQN